METKAKSVILLLLIGAAAALDPKIVGGEETTIEDVPYQLELENALLGVFWQFSCGSVIVGPNAVLTAGHCVSNAKPENVRFRSGSATRGNGVIHKVETITLHPNYTENQISDNDIAFITVSPPFEFSETTRAIAIRAVAVATGEIATISGWGITSETSTDPPKVLRKVDVPVINQTVCEKNYEDLTEISPAMFCAGAEEGGKDSCSGDSGGPLTINGTLAGLVSWGYGCAEPGSPGVYTNVFYFYQWIQDQLESAKQRLIFKG